MSTEESKKMLRRHVYSKTNLVIMFVDINDSTNMSLSLSQNKFALIMQTFAQEMSIAVSGDGGYVFKYEGDAVISLFPAEYDQVKACKNALSCSKAMLEIIREVINPAFNGIMWKKSRKGPHRYNRFKYKYGCEDCICRKT
jgi:class 3 adenylate cyclase